MSKYTTELRWIIENNYSLGMISYPIFDENYRASLNAKIVEHYYFREIAFETVALFVRFLNRKMNEIMPYYNQLYQSALLKITPLTRLDYTEDYKKQGASNSKGNVNTDTTQNQTGSQTDKTGANTKDVFSDTPQGLLAIGDVSGEIYASSANFGSSDTNLTSKTSQDASSNSAMNSTQTLNSTENYLKTIMGNNASRTDAEMLLEYRQTFLNIDMMVIEELSQLFFNLY